jgi:hypothetical protein
VGAADPIPDLLLVDLQVSGSVAVGDSPTFPSPAGNFLAVADPPFEIDPNFPFRDQFALTFSPNLGTPEPGTLILMAAAGMALFGYRVRWHV